MKRTSAILALLLAAPVPAMAATAPCDSKNKSVNAIWIEECDAAIKAATNPARKSDLLFHRAYAAVEQQKPDDALAFLNQALALNSGNWQAHRERAYVLGEFERHREALVDIEATLALSPGNLQAYSERAWTRKHLADFKGSLEDADRVLASQPDNGDMIGGRIGSLLWMGRIQEAEAGIGQLQALGERKTDREIVESAKKWRARLAVYQDRSPMGDPKTLCENALLKPDLKNDHAIGDCTAAYWQADRPTEKAKHLTARSVAWLTIKQDEEQSRVDQKMAVALDPSNADWQSNLGFSYLSNRHSWAARNAFNR